VRIYYEGAIYGQVGMRRLADRVRHAHGRLSTAYPTRAVRLVPPEALVAVGTFDADVGRIVPTGPDSEREMAAWLGNERLDQAELLVGGEPPAAARPGSYRVLPAPSGWVPRGGSRASWRPPTHARPP
jgi:hypothetical protein